MIGSILNGMKISSDSGTKTATRTSTGTDILYTVPSNAYALISTCGVECNAGTGTMDAYIYIGDGIGNNIIVRSDAGASASDSEQLPNNNTADTISHVTTVFYASAGSTISFTASISGSKSVTGWASITVFENGI